MSTPHPVTPSFLASLAPLTSNGAGGLLPASGSPTLYPRIGDSAPTAGDWSIGTGAGITMTAATLAALQGGRANGDGSYTDQSARVWVLVLSDAGSCEPSGPPPE